MKQKGRAEREKITEGLMDDEKLIFKHMDNWFCPTMAGKSMNPYELFSLHLSE